MHVVGYKLLVKIFPLVGGSAKGHHIKQFCQKLQFHSFENHHKDWTMWWHPEFQQGQVPMCARMTRMVVVTEGHCNTFPMCFMVIIDDPCNANAIKWSADGKSIHVVDNKLLEKIFPFVRKGKYMKNFCKQMHYYCFRHRPNNLTVLMHPEFQQGEAFICARMTAKLTSPTLVNITNQSLSQGSACGMLLMHLTMALLRIVSGPGMLLMRLMMAFLKILNGPILIAPSRKNQVLRVFEVEEKFWSWPFESGPFHLWFPLCNGEFQWWCLFAFTCE